MKIIVNQPTHVFVVKGEIEVSDAEGERLIALGVATKKAEKKKRAE